MPNQLSTTELQAWLSLAFNPSISARVARSLLAAYGMPQEVLAASHGTLARHLSSQQISSLKQPDAALTSALQLCQNWLGQEGNHIISLADRLYPHNLLQLSDPPLLLFAKGRLALLGQPAIAVVGARHATLAGLENAHAFAKYLAQHNWCIISGLASGIDGAAHRGALAAGPNGAGTIAILGTGIDRVYPAAHHELARTIARDGLLLSEFMLGTPGLKYNFPKRNRLVAALAQGVLVVEAARKSGSLITASQAAELGREVFAIPGSIHSPLSHGCHALIRQGAKLVESGQDIHDELQQPGLPGSVQSRPDGPAAEPAQPDLSDAQRQLLQELGYEPTSLDSLQQRLAWPLDKIQQNLAMLELLNLTRRLADGRYQRLGK